MVGMRSRGTLLPLVLGALAAVMCLSYLEALTFTGASAGRPVGGAASLRSSKASMSALPQVEGPIPGLADSSGLLLADNLDAVPLVAFVVSAFLGIVGYSVWTAFGPGAEDLRDPFEEHED
uniref:Uncharacterized protein n=1 Tax=Alexandrium catenella TaxID=2925 RepID=A0A7S1RUZ1_ALECA|mmetsp:Transcript_74408/g.197653  ORF Transcript_74408/g.197653 Transcript_74408/m.197653 type:complete len:121 (+) Transcript_74408:54-416(+)